jgi:hypothetical protein
VLEREKTAVGIIDRMQYLWVHGLAFLAGNLRYYRLVLKEEGGGYILVTSPDLPGFSFLLRPNEHGDFLAVGGAVRQALEQYIQVEEEALARKSRRRHAQPHPVQFSGITQDGPGELIARFRAA